MVIAIVLGPTFIDWLRLTGVGQQIREEGPARHIVKQGTPTMGGLLILATAIVPFLLLTLHTMPGLALLFLTLGCALIGFTDDYLKVRKRRSLGLSGRWKMLGLVLITIGVGWVVTQVGYLDTEIYFPVVDVNIDLALVLLPLPLRRHRGHGERRQPDRRARRARRGHVRDLAAHLPRDRRHLLDPLRARSATAATTSSTSRSSPRR